MREIDEGLIVKIHLINEIMNHIYMEHGFEGCPFDDDDKDRIILICRGHIMRYFRVVFGSEEDSEKAMNLFASCKGTVFLFVVMLNDEMKSKLLDSKWEDVRDVVLYGG
jgi:hypothetical protein